MRNSPRLTQLLAIFTLGLVLLTVGCASNPYEKFYTPIGPPRAPTSNASPPPQVLRGGEQYEDTVAMLENGYAFIGYASFNGRATDLKEAVEYGQTLGAAAVIIYSRYTDTMTGSIPLVLPNPPVTSTTTMQGSITGTGGYANYTGTATTTTSGGSTAHQIPYRVDRYDQSAGYFIKAGKPILGLHSRDLNPDERARLERNRGVIAIAVRKESPAFRADLLRGDVVIEFAGEAVESQNQLKDLVPKHAGERVMIKVIRGGVVRELQV